MPMNTANAQVKLNINIDLEAMGKLGISLQEYSIAYLIKEKMTDPKSQVEGWAAYSKEDLARYLKLSKMTIFRSLKKLYEKGLVERLGKSQYIRTTSKWYQYTNGIPSTILVSPIPDKEKVTQKEINKHTSPSEMEESPKRRSSCPLDVKNQKTMSTSVGDVYRTLPQTALQRRYPHGHDECVEYLQDEEEKRGFKFINHGKQYVAIHKILKAGFGFDHMDKTIRQVSKAYGEHSWDYMTLANWLEKGSGQ